MFPSSPPDQGETWSPSRANLFFCSKLKHPLLRNISSSENLVILIWDVFTSLSGCCGGTWRNKKIDISKYICGGSRNRKIYISKSSRKYISANLSVARPREDNWLVVQPPPIAQNWETGKRWMLNRVTFRNSTFSEIKLAEPTTHPSIAKNWETRIRCVE